MGKVRKVVRLVCLKNDSFTTEKTRFPPKRLVFPLSENPILPSRL